MVAGAADGAVASLDLSARAETPAGPIFAEEIRHPRSDRTLGRPFPRALVLLSGTTMTVHVRANGKPLAKALVWLKEPRIGYVPAVTDVEGVARHIFQKGPVGVSVEANGFAKEHRDWVVPGNPVAIAFDLEPEATLEGRVRGTAMCDGEIEAIELYSGFHAASTTYDQRGGFVLHGLKAGCEYRLVAESFSFSSDRFQAEATAPDNDVVVWPTPASLLKRLASFDR